MAYISMGAGGLGPPPSSGNAPGWGNLGGGWLPTAMGNYYAGNIPQWFVKPPQGVSALSPLAQAYLSRMFPVGDWGGGTAEYISANPAMTVQSAFANPVPGWESEPIADVTAVQMPRTPSAQLYSQLSGQGALPALKSYFDNILGSGAWEAFIAPLQALWPAAQTERPVQWQTAKQK